jgi:hypothetical protein
MLSVMYTDCYNDEHNNAESCYAECCDALIIVINFTSSLVMFARLCSLKQFR